MTEVIAVQGKEKILMVRKLGDKTAAARPALQIEHTLKYERKNETTATKDGAVVSGGGLETTLEIKGLASRDKTNELLRDSVIQGFKLEIWEVDLGDKKSDGKYGALYMQGALNSWEIPSKVGELVENSTEANIDGVPQAGSVTLTEDQAAEINYAFKDIAGE